MVKWLQINLVAGKMRLPKTKNGTRNVPTTFNFYPYCPSLTLPARKVKERSPSPTTRSPMDFAFSNVFRGRKYQRRTMRFPVFYEPEASATDNAFSCFLRAGSVSDGQMMH